MPDPPHRRPSVGAVLDELEAVAKAAMPGEWPDADLWRRHIDSEPDADYIAAASPATALALIEVARAAQRLSLLPCPRDINGDGDCGAYLCPHCGLNSPRADLRAALGRLTEGRAE